MSLLEVRHVSRHFGGNRAVDDVSFEINSGELLALIGPNGAGKSTLFNMLGGQLPATSGSVLFDGKELLGLPSHRIAHLGIGRSFQIAATFASLTVVENVQAALLSARRQIWSFWKQARSLHVDDAMSLLEQVGMHEQAFRPCSELAYGDVKRVELAMSLAGEPRLLLMDEPTAGMAPSERVSLIKLVRSLVEEREMAVLFTEHSMDVVFGYADRIIVLARGKLIAEGQADYIRAHPEVQSVYFGKGRTFDTGGDAHFPQQREPAGDAQLPEEGVSAGDVRSQEDGRYVCDSQSQPGPRVRQPDALPKDPVLRSGSLRVAVPTLQPGQDTPLLAVRGLNAWYGAAHILHDVSFNVGRGEVLALVGRNGAGKSTTLKALMGLVADRCGDIQFMGKSLAHCKPFEAARRGLGYVPEDRRIFTGLTVQENLMAGQQPPRVWPDGASVPYWSLDEVFTLFPALASMRGRQAGMMSGGEQQMLTVARTLMGNPYLLLLDEPSEGVAPIIVEHMVEMMLMLKQKGTSLLLCEQNLHFAALVADRACVLEKGLVRYTGPMQALAQDHDLRQKYLSL